MTSTGFSLSNRGAVTPVRRARNSPDQICRVSTNQAAATERARDDPSRDLRGASGVVDRTVRLAPEDERQLQGEGLARVGRGEMGQVGDLTQAVAHRVGVDEERASGGLQ